MSLRGNRERGRIGRRKGKVRNNVTTVKLYNILKSFKINKRKKKMYSLSVPLNSPILL